MMTRTVTAEVLDHLAPDDPAARRSRHDLARIHRVIGTRSMICRGWRQLVSPSRAGTPLRILELGAGDGRLLLRVARSLAPHWPHVQLRLLDRQDIVTPATLAAFAALGWEAQVQVADVMAWAARRLPSPQWDLITTALFLHHFTAGELALLLGAAASRCDRFFACEPSRTRLALAGSHLVGAIGANAVTRSDAVSSVQAGFCHNEISAQWPQGRTQWQVREFDAGLFSHCFSARRLGSWG